MDFYYLYKSNKSEVTASKLNFKYFYSMFAF